MLRNILYALTSLLFCIFGTTAYASVYSFNGVNANEINVSNRLSLDVTQVGNNVAFKISNAAGGTTIFVGHIYFEFLGANLFSSLTQTGQQGTVSFTGDATSNQNFPERNSIGFSTDADADRNGGAGNGINIGEYIILSAILNPNANIDSLLGNGGLRIGLHIQGFAGGGSDSYVSGPPSSVPVPAAGWLFGSALIGLMGLRRRM